MKKCSNCYWCQEKEGPSRHIGCYARGKWRKWIPRKQVDVPTECPDWKGIPGGPTGGLSGYE